MSLSRRFMLAIGLAASLSFAAPVAVPSALAASQSKQQVIMGWVEYVYLQDLSGRLKAKLDTGATTSSMRAEVVKVLDEKHPEKTSILFKIEDADGKVNSLQRQLVRWVKIKGKDGTSHRRPVVEMDFCISGHLVKSEVNLAPRTDFIYPILVGRNMMRDANIIVDPSRTFTSRARCPDLTEDKDN